MSSSTQSRRNRPGRTLTALVILACVVQWLGAGAAAAAEVTVVSAGTSRTDGLVSLVVDIGAAPSESNAPAAEPTFSVTADTVPEQVDAVPMLSDQLAVGFVVDGSEEGRAALQSGLTGASNFVLEQRLTGAAVVADKSPPNVMSTPEARPTDVVRALSAIQAEGQRQTSEALSVALRELERIPARSRMLILHTAAADAGGEPAADLAARLVDAHTPLAVVSTAPDPGYWRDVTGLTGGVLIAQGVGNAFAAFDQVADAMRGRYLLTFTPTHNPPFEVTVRVDTADSAATADAVVPEPATSPAAAPAPAADLDSGARGPLLLMIAALLAVLGLVFFMQARRARPAVAADLDAGGSGLLGRLPPGLRLPDLSRLARPARPYAEPPTAPMRVDSPPAPMRVDSPAAPTRVASPLAPRKGAFPLVRPRVTSPVARSTVDSAAATWRVDSPAAPVKVDSRTTPTRVDSPTTPTRVDSPTTPIHIDAATGAPNPTGASAAAADTVPTSTAPATSTAPPAVPPVPTFPPAPTTTPPTEAAPPTEAVKGSDAPARARNGALSPARAANGTDTVTVPTSANRPSDAPKGTARTTNGPSGAGDTSAGAQDEAGTAAPPRPRSPLPEASEPPEDHEADPLATSGFCVCGCGRKVRPGRAFINWEHQSRWMRAAWDGHQEV